MGKNEAVSIHWNDVSHCSVAARSEWQMYFEAKRDQESLLPLGKNAVIAVECQAEFLVDGDMAHAVITEERHVMKRTILDGGIRATFSGRLKLD